MEFPKFQRSDVLGWILKCERYFKLDETPEELKVMMASLHLDEKAFQWHQAFENTWETEILEWEEYVVALKNRFGPSYEAPMEDLMCLRQQGTLAEFNDQFDSISCKLRLPEEYLVHAYVAGLQEELAGLVRLFKPVTLLEARSLARVQEINMQKKLKGVTAGRNSITGVKNSSNHDSGSGFVATAGQAKWKNYKNALMSNGPHQATLMEGGFPSKARRDTGLASSGLNQSKTGDSLKRILTPEEVEEHRVNNLCFYCHEKYTKDHVCPQRRKLQLHLVEYDTEEDVEEEGTTESGALEDPSPLRISLHAIEGIDNIS